MRASVKRSCSPYATPFARLYLIAPFWERLGFGIRRLYRWDNPRRTATAAMVYFVLWWTDLLPTAFCLAIMYCE